MKSKASVFSYVSSSSGLSILVRVPLKCHVETPPDSPLRYVRARSTREMLFALRILIALAHHTNAHENECNTLYESSHVALVGGLKPLQKYRPTGKLSLGWNEK